MIDLDLTEEKIPTRKATQFLAAAVACMGCFGLGTVAGWTSPALMSLKNSTELGLVPESTQSWIGSIAPIGCFISGPVAGFLIDAIGRKRCMLVMALPFILGWLLIGFAQNVAMILVGRLLTGLGGGSFTLAAPVYISEIAEDSIRGTLGSALQLMINCGVLFVYVIGSYLEWQDLAFVCAGIPALFIILMIFIPESPRHLVSKGKDKEAAKALSWLRGLKVGDQILNEIQSVKEIVKETERVSLRSFFELKILIPLGLSLALMFFQQWNGNNAVVFYTAAIFTDAGSDLDPNMATIIIGIVMVVASIVSSILMDKAGRRILLFISGIVMAIALIILGIFFHIKKTDQETAATIGWLPLACLILFIVAFSIGFGPIAWLMQGEILPPNVKGMKNVAKEHFYHTCKFPGQSNIANGITGAMATSFNWLNTFVVTKVFENIKSGIGAEWNFFIFGIASALGTIFVYFFVPETKGKSLMEIQLNFIRNR